VVQGVRSNEQRMQAIGFHANRYRLVCFVISGTICGLAGALLANNTDFISPATMYWTRSGDLMVMVNCDKNSSSSRKTMVPMTGEQRPMPPRSP